MRVLAVLLLVFFVSGAGAQSVRPCFGSEGDKVDSCGNPMPPRPSFGGLPQDYRHTLHSGRDPLTPPRTKTDTVPSSIPGIPGLRTRCQFMHSQIILVVSFRGAESAARQCVNEGIGAGMVAAVVATVATGGGGPAAGSSVAYQYIGACLAARLPGATVRIENPTGWGDWGGC